MRTSAVAVAPLRQYVVQQASTASVGQQQPALSTVEAEAGSGVGVGADGWRQLPVVDTVQADGLDRLIQGLLATEGKQTVLAKIDGETWLEKKMLLVVVVMIDGQIHALNVGHKNPDCMMVWLRSANDVIQRRRWMTLPATEEVSLPWMAAVVDDGLDVAGVMSDLDGLMGCSPSVSIDDVKAAVVQAVAVRAEQRRHQAEQHRCRRAMAVTRWHRWRWAELRRRQPWLPPWMGFTVYRLLVHTVYRLLVHTHPFV
ncbi:hypothetical protein ACLOJK_026692 [Asimina triloba]